MALRRRSIFPFLVLSAVLSLCACEDNGGTLRVNAVGPSPLAPTAGFVNVQRGAMVQPAFIDPVFVPGGFCPTVPPFLAPFSIVFEGDGRAERFVTQVHMQFVDHFGVLGGSMVLTHAQLATRFGSTTIPAFGTRAFPLSFPFGCVGAPTGLLSVVALAVDAFGHETSTRTQVRIR